MKPEDKDTSLGGDEIFKIIDSNDTLKMESFDDFEKEAAAGLAMVKDRDRLKRIHDRIDEKLKEKKKKRGGILWLSAAASLVVVLGLIYLVAPHLNKNTEEVAAAEISNTENPVVNSDGKLVEPLRKTEEIDLSKSQDSMKLGLTKTTTTNSLTVGDVLNNQVLEPAEDKKLESEKEVLTEGKANTFAWDQENSEKERSGKFNETARKNQNEDYLKSLSKEKEEKQKADQLEVADNNYTKTNGTVLADEKAEGDQKKLFKNPTTITPITGTANDNMVYNATPATNMGPISNTGISPATTNATYGGTFTTTTTTTTVNTTPGFSFDTKKPVAGKTSKNGDVDYRAAADSLMKRDDNLNTGYFASNRLEEKNEAKEKDKVVYEQQKQSEVYKQGADRQNSGTGNQSPESYSENVGMNNGMVSTKGGKKNDEKAAVVNKKQSSNQSPAYPQKSTQSENMDGIYAKASLDSTANEVAGYGEIDLRNKSKNTGKDEWYGNTGISSESVPQYPGGIGAMQSFFMQNIKLTEQSKSVTGKVIVSFAIGVDGSVSDIKVYKSIPGCDDCTKEVIRVVKLMPKWKPVMKAGKPIVARYNLPVKF